MKRYNKQAFLGIILIMFAGSLAAQSKISSLPAGVQQCVGKNDQPTSELAVQKIGDQWWRASYMSGHESYTEACNINGEGIAISLPVRETTIDPGAENRLIQTYGPSIYDITEMKGVGNSDEYIVRVLENGQMKTVRVIASDVNSH